MSYKDKEKQKAWYQNHPDRKKVHNRRYNLTHQEQNNARYRAYELALKAEALRVLGNKCACPGCGISEPLFLTIDHINGRPKGSRKDPVLEAKASGWDKTKFQILCMNCNFTKRDRGFCPVHQKRSEETNDHSPSASPQLKLLPL